MLSDAEQLSQIDAEVAALRDNICQLYNKRNRFVPISRLPPEILSRVFLYLQDLGIVNAQSPHSRNLQPLKLSWIVTTHVCRRWRDVAFEFPDLWANIDMSVSVPCQWAEVFLERSKAAPLAVTIPASLRDSLTNTASRILEQPHRLQLLKISGYPQLHTTSQAMELLQSLSGVSMPILQSMILDFEDPYYGHMASTTLALPSELCSGGTPVLRHLELRGCGILWRSPIFNNLTSLTMTRGTVGLQGSFNDFLDALERMSKIQEIDLCIVLPPGTQSIAGHTTVAFPKLKKLALKTSLPGCTTILNHLALQTSTYLDLEVRIPGPRSLNAATVHTASSEFASAINVVWSTTSLLPPQTTITPKPSICALEITPARTAGGGGKARFWFDAINLARRPICLTKDKRRVVTPPPPAPLAITITPTPYICILIAALPIQSLQSIDLKIPIDQWMWARLAALPYLQSIALNEETGPSFFTYVYGDPAMVSRPPQPPEKRKQTPKHKRGKSRTAKFRFRRPDPSSYLCGKLILKKTKEASDAVPLSSSPTKPTYFPNLSHLAFTGVDFGLEQYSYPEEGAGIHWDRFLEFLLFRRESHKPIQFIRALTCVNLMKPDVVSIKTVVPTVEWDGIEERRDDDDLEEDWDASHDSEDCEGQCDEHLYRHQGHYGSSLLAAAFSF